MNDASAATILAVLTTSAWGVAAAQPPAAAARVLDGQAAPGAVSTLSGYAVWSRRVGGAYRLMVRHNGVTRSAPVRSRAGAFDVRLGRDGGRRIVATYSRCRQEGPDLRHCRLVALDLRSGRERALRLQASPGISSRFDPVLAGNTVAYAALAGKTHVAVYVQTLGPKGRPRRLPGGSPGLEAQPVGIDFDGRHVAYSWNLGEPACVTDPNNLDDTSSELWVDDLRTGTHRLISRAGCPGDTAGLVLDVEIDQRRLFFAQSNGVLGRYDLHARQTGYARLPRGNIVAAAPQPNGYFLLLKRLNLANAQLLQERLTFARRERPSSDARART